MKKTIPASILFILCCLAAPLASGEEMKLELKAGATMKEVLAEQTGKRVALRLASGEEVEGTVTSVGDSLAHLSRLAGRDFYDAVVSIEQVSAVRIKVRDR